MAAQYTELADALKVIIDAEFAPEGYTAAHDNLHPAVGLEGTRIGLAPEEESPATANMLQQNTTVTVKFYRRWDADVDPTKKIDPRVIAVFAERLRKALRTANTASTGQVWFFNLVRVTYPNDPTGNKTRFEATIVAYGNNQALVETTG